MQNCWTNFQLSRTLHLWLSAWLSVDWSAIILVSLVYHAGPPSKPDSLSSQLPSAGVLVLSWSPPWAPDGVQLYYTVTVTNTNSSMMSNYSTSNTSIIINRGNGDGECDQYVWSVTAVNPAGPSHPTDNNETVSFVPGTVPLVCWYFLQFLGIIISRCSSFKREHFNQ